MVAESLSILAFTTLPDDIGPLLAGADAEGHNLVRRLVEDWVDGSNRFDRPGEVALSVRSDGRLVAIGGLNRDPYLDDPDVGRIRHLYVSPSSRRRGIGRLIVVALIDHGRANFSRVRLRTSQRDASRFYMAIGFSEIEEADATHEIRF